MTEHLSDERLKYMSEDPFHVNPAHIKAAIDELLTIRTLCAEVYQAVGALANAAGVFETSPEVERVLDNLAAAGDGRPLSHETLTPFQVRDVGPAIDDLAKTRDTGPVMPDWLVEVVARAICEERFVESHEEASARGLPALDDPRDQKRIDRCWPLFVRHAKAALTAIHHAGQVMLRAQIAEMESR